MTVASVGLPGFADAGNLWNWLPQLRVTRELGATSLGGTSLHWALQGAILDPFSGIQSLNEEYGVDAGERAGRPYLQSRLRVRWGAGRTDVATGRGAATHGGEIGVGVHRGWLRLTGDTLTTSDAMSLDARIGLHHGLELRGEAYRGRALAGLGGGGIGQNFGVPAAGAAFGQPLRDAGGWMQLNWQAAPHPAHRRRLRHRRARRRRSTGAPAQRIVRRSRPVATRATAALRRRGPSPAHDVRDAHRQREPHQLLLRLRAVRCGR